MEGYTSPPSDTAASGKASGEVPANAPVKGTDILTSCAAGLLLVAVCAWGSVRLFSYGSWWQSTLGLAALGLAALYCATAHRSYRMWLDTRVPGPWLSAQIAPALGGVAVVVVGCFLLRWGSNIDRRSVASLAVALIMGGLFPVVHIIHSKSDTGQPKEKRLWTKESFLAIALNAFSVFLALAPFVLVLGVPLMGAVAVGVLWLIAVGLGRHVPGPKVGFAGLVVAAIGLVAMFVDGGLAQFLLGAAALFGGAWIFSLRVITKLSSGPTPWFLTLPLRDAVQHLPDGDFNPMSRHGFRWNKAVIAGMGMAAVSGVLIARFGLRSEFGSSSLATVIVASVVMMLLGAIFIMRGEGYALIAVIAVVAVWVIQDGDATPEWTIDNGSAKQIVVLGDSYSSGEGSVKYLPGTNIENGNNCRRAPSSYGFIIADRFGRQLTTFACSGAKASQIDLRGQISGTSGTADGGFRAASNIVVRDTDDGGEIAGRLPQLANMADDVASADVDVVLMSIGGNDALFGDIGRACAMPGTCSAVSDLVDENLVLVTDKVARVLVEVATKFDNSMIILIAYPGVLGSSPVNTETLETKPSEITAAGCTSDGDPGAPLDTSELCYLRGFLRALNTTLATAVDDANDTLEQTTGETATITWVGETETAFDLAESTASDPLAAPNSGDPMNMIQLAPTGGTSLYERIFPAAWIHNSFHPTAEGHRRIACVVERKLITLDDSPFFGQSASEGCAGVGTGAIQRLDATTPANQPLLSVSSDSESVIEKNYGKEVQQFGVSTALDAARGVIWLEGLLLMLIGWLAAVIGRFGTTGASWSSWINRLRPQHD